MYWGVSDEVGNIPGQETSRRHICWIVRAGVIRYVVLDANRRVFRTSEEGHFS